MTKATLTPIHRKSRANLGSLTALAESAWMGSPLAADVLEQLYLAPATWLRRGKAILPRLPRQIQLRGLLTRELSIAEASFVLGVLTLLLFAVLFANMASNNN